MKKLLSLLSVLTISGSAVPTAIATSPYQKEETINSDINYQQINNLESLKRVKRWDWFDRNIGDKLGDAANTIKEKIGDAANTVKNIAVIGWDNSLGHKISKSVNHEGGTFTAEWRPVQILYWQLKMDDAACKLVLNNLSSSGEFAAKSSLMAIVGGLFLAGGVSGPIGALASASVAVNFWAIKSIVENKNNGNGVWVGFWLNQPGVGFGSL